MLLKTLLIGTVLFGLICCTSGLPVNGNSSSQAQVDSLFPVVPVLISICLFVIIVTVVIGCLCCRENSFKILSAQNGITVPHHNVAPQTQLPMDNVSEFTIFPPPSSGIVFSQPNSPEDKVSFEPLPKIFPRTSTSPSKRPTVPRPAHFNGAVSKESSVKDWFDEPQANFPRNQLQYLRELGSGWFGQVVKGEAQSIIPCENKSSVIVKILRSDASPSEHVCFLHEVQVFRKLNHPNIMRLFGRCLETDPFLIIMESTAMDLKSFLIQQRSNSETLIRSGALLKGACSIAAGLEYMHQSNFVHMDLAARNCVITSDEVIKIGDYGTSIQTYKDDYYVLGEVAIPIRWCAPETLYCTDIALEAKDVTKEANVWSFGVLLWELLEFCKLPYFEMTDEDVLQKVVVQKHQLLEQPKIPGPHVDRLYQIMLWCWNESEKRPAIKDLVVLLTHLYDNKDVGANCEDFEARWNSLRPSIQEHNLQLGLPTSLQSHLKFESDFLTAESQKRWDYSTFNAAESASMRETSPSSDLFSSAANFSANISPSLQNLHGSIEDLKAGGDKYSSGKVKHPSNGSSKDEVTAEHITEALRDLDNILAAEGCSSSTPSEHMTPDQTPSTTLLHSQSLDGPDDRPYDDFSLGYGNESEEANNSLGFKKSSSVEDLLNEGPEKVAEMFKLTIIDDEGSDIDTPKQLSLSYMGALSEGDKLANCDPVDIWSTGDKTVVSSPVDTDQKTIKSLEELGSRLQGASSSKEQLQDSSLKENGTAETKEDFVSSSQCLGDMKVSLSMETPSVCGASMLPSCASFTSGDGLVNNNTVCINCSCCPAQSTPQKCCNTNHSKVCCSNNSADSSGVELSKSCLLSNLNPSLSLDVTPIVSPDSHPDVLNFSSDSSRSGVPNSNNGKDLPNESLYYSASLVDNGLGRWEKLSSFPSVFSVAAQDSQHTISDAGCDSMFVTAQSGVSVPLSSSPSLPLDSSSENHDTSLSTLVGNHHFLSLNSLSSSTEALPEPMVEQNHLPTTGDGEDVVHSENAYTDFEVISSEVPASAGDSNPSQGSEDEASAPLSNESATKSISSEDLDDKLPSVLPYLEQEYVGEDAQDNTLDNNNTPEMQELDNMSELESEIEYFYKYYLEEDGNAEVYLPPKDQVLHDLSDIVLEVIKEEDEEEIMDEEASEEASAGHNVSGQDLEYQIQDISEVLDDVDDYSKHNSINSETLLFFERGGSETSHAIQLPDTPKDMSSGKSSMGSSARTYILPDDQYDFEDEEEILTVNTDTNEITMHSCSTLERSLSSDSALSDDSRSFENVTSSRDTRLDSKSDSVLKALKPDLFIEGDEVLAGTEEDSEDLSDTDDTSSTGTSCSTTSGSFECIMEHHSKSLDDLSVTSAASAVVPLPKTHSLESTPVKMSTWNSSATPTKSALKSTRSVSSLNKTVSFHEEKSPVVYQYPPAESSSEEQEEEDFPIYDTGVDYANFEDWDFQISLDDEEIPDDIVEIGDLDSSDDDFVPLRPAPRTPETAPSTMYSISCLSQDDLHDFTDESSSSAPCESSKAESSKGTLDRLSSNSNSYFDDSIFSENPPWPNFSPADSNKSPAGGDKRTTLSQNPYFNCDDSIVDQDPPWESASEIFDAFSDDDSSTECGTPKKIPPKRNDESKSSASEEVSPVCVGVIEEIHQPEQYIYMSDEDDDSLMNVSDTGIDEAFAADCLANDYYPKDEENNKNSADKIAASDRESARNVDNAHRTNCNNPSDLKNGEVLGLLSSSGFVLDKRTDFVQVPNDGCDGLLTGSDMNSNQHKSIVET